MAHHRLRASVETVHWGWFASNLKPVLTVDSGDRVTVETVSGGPANLPGAGFHVPPELLRIHEKSERRLPGHILTGPIAVRGAMPGDVLEIRIVDVRLRQDWGYTFIRPLAGALPNDFARVRADDHRARSRAPSRTAAVGIGAAAAAVLRRDRRRAAAGVGQHLVDPATRARRQPRQQGADPRLDAVLAGVQRGRQAVARRRPRVQGDGEVCVTAIETAIEGTVEMIVRKDLGFTFPRAETPTHRITMGMDPSLDNAATHALRQMIDWVTATTPLTRQQAFMLMSLAADVHVTQLVNEHKGIHVMLPKSALAPSRGD